MVEMISEHNGVDFVEISKIFMTGHAFVRLEPLDRGDIT